MKILFLTSYQKPIDGWSIVGFNIVKSLKNFDLEIFSGDQKKILKFGAMRLKSELYDRYKLLAVIFDVINILLFVRKTCEKLRHKKYRYKKLVFTFFLHE